MIFVILITGYGSSRFQVRSTKNTSEPTRWFRHYIVDSADRFNIGITNEYIKLVHISNIVT